MNRQLAEWSTTDVLTGLANRRQFEEEMEKAWLCSKNHVSPLSVALIDVDKFKHYNDHYGHPQGDTCLRTVAQSLKNLLRGNDLVARYGGEEFVVILPEVTLEKAVQVGERLRKTVQDLQIPHEKCERGVVSISIEVASVIADDTLTISDFISRADTALYREKALGRNRVESDLSFTNREV